MVERFLNAYCCSHFFFLFFVVGPLFRTNDMHFVQQSFSTNTTDEKFCNARAPWHFIHKHTIDSNRDEFSICIRNHFFLYIFCATKWIRYFLFSWVVTACDLFVVQNSIVTRHSGRGQHHIWIVHMSLYRSTFVSLFNRWCAEKIIFAEIYRR